MSRSKTVSFRCGHEGCGEVGHFSYRNAREDGRRLMLRYDGGKWRCTRHGVDAAEVLTPTNTFREVVLVSRGDPRLPGHLFWEREGKECGASGFTYGNGWQAWTKDFPEGTRLVVRVTAELPESARG